MLRPARDISPRREIENRLKESEAGVISDITQLKQAEEALVKAGKLESLMVLAGGIAHDFNNLMTVVLGNVALTRMLYGENHEADRLLVEAEKAVKQARSLTQQLITFARGGQPVKTPAPIRQILEDAAGFALAGSKAQARIIVPDDLWPVEADNGQISQVFTNLIINAVQAMPEGGTIKLRAENITFTDTQITPLHSGDYIKISVEDPGVGIPPEDAAKIFDPYFTTKFNGSGLGLATAYSIIKGHDGCIEVESVPYQGTVFRVYLPASTGTESETE